MKVCGKRDVLVPECSDCSELEERVEAVEECCDDAHEEIDTLNIGKADKGYVDDSIENVNQTIANVADTLGGRIDNIITASEPSVTTLWEGVMESIGDSANLSEDVNDFDYLDIYYRTSADESEGYYNTVRIPADQFANYTITVGGTMSPLGESPTLNQYLTQLSFVDDTATIDNIREWSWNGSQSSDASDDPQAETGVTIYRIDGVKETGGNAEIADAREGVDGTIYPSLGDAIRGQIQDTRDMIPQLIKTVNGNPIVLDDAFGEVKKLDVELLPIQDLHGYDKPWAGGAGKNIFDQSVRRMPINLPSGTTLYVKHNATGTYGLYGLDENETSVELSMMSPNTLYTVTLDRNITLLAISQDFLDDLVQNNATLMVSKTTFTTIEPYENICPITGHDSVTVTDTGKNLFDKSTALDGYINDVNGNFMPSQTRKATDFIRVFGGESYLIKTAQTESEWGAWYDANKNFIVKCNGYEGDTVKTAPANACYLRLTCVGTSSGNLDTFAVNYPSTDTAYHAYHGQSKTVTLPHTVYGAGVGVTSGSGKEKWNFVTLTGNETYRAFGTTIVCSSVTVPTGASHTDILCNYAATPTVGWSTNAMKQFQFKDADTYWGVSDADEFKALIASFNTAGTPLTICYRLADALDLSTTPTDLTLYNGDNVVSSDGDMELSYVQDMAIVIRKLEAQI